MLSSTFLRKAGAADAECRFGPSQSRRSAAGSSITRTSRPRSLFEVARLVVSAGIAKIHTIEWTPQLLYDEPLYKGMNANWNGLLGANGGEVLTEILADIVTKNFGRSTDVAKSTQWYSVFASGPGIFGLGSKNQRLRRHQARTRSTAASTTSAPPFNFPEEFVTVYRLHPLVAGPD